MALTQIVYAPGSVLYMALELSDKKWLLGFSNGRRMRKQQVDALNQGATLEAIGKAKAKLGLPPQCKVISCYEAGWEGFWLHRWLESEGIINHVVDSAAIEVSRKKRRAKTDRIDVEKLLGQLERFCGGERRALSIVRVPEQTKEDDRHLHRERTVLIKERGDLMRRINSLLRCQGIRWNKRNVVAQLDTLRLWNGDKLPAQLKERLQREWERHELLDKQIKVLERQQKERIKSDQTCQKIEQLLRLKGIGIQGAWQMHKELFSWREFKNRRELGALVGLTPTPYSSGDSSQELGISKAGSKRLRPLLIELSWLWLRYQPQSQLSQWFNRRFAHGGKRMRRIGIVALARKLLIAIWRYYETGVIPEGAVLKTAI